MVVVPRLCLVFGPKFGHVLGILAFGSKIRICLSCLWFVGQRLEMSLVLLVLGPKFGDPRAARFLLLK